MLSLQTNGTLIDQEWARFFRKYHFLIGVSLDGPEPIHDARRINAAGKGSFAQAKRGFDHLRQNGVDFNVLTVIHEDNVKCAEELMRFYKEENFTYVHFIPCMDFRSQEPDKAPTFLISPREYGSFLCEAFDLWYNDGVPELSVRLFDNMLMQELGHEAELCIHREACPTTLVLEQNGDAYPCDFYMSPEYWLGNVGTDLLQDILAHPAGAAFQSRKPSLPEACKQCEFLRLCHGGCPRNRKRGATAKELYPDYFCESYKMLYVHAAGKLAGLAVRVRRSRLEQYVKSSGEVLGNVARFYTMS